MPQYNFRLTRVFVTGDLSAENTFQASDSQAHYLGRVLRKRAGDQVLVFNGRDGEWLAEIASVSKRACALNPLKLVRAQTPPSDILCCFAPLKKGRMDYVVQKAVEMGAGTLQPVVTEFTQAERVKVARMEANVIEAAEQCGVLSVPEVASPVSLDQLIDGWASDRVLVFGDEAADVGDPVAALRTSNSSRFGVLIGPEGGFSPRERERLQGLPFVTTIALGPRILRADTALVAALTVVQIAVGDWTN